MEPTGEDESPTLGLLTEQAKSKDHSLISREEASLLLKKWRDESTRLRFVAVLDELKCALDCRVASVELSGVVLRLTDERDVCAVSLSDCLFSWGEPQDLPEGELVRGEHTFSSVLLVIP